MTAGPDQDLWVGSVPGLYQGYFPGMGSTVITPAEKNYFTWLVLKAHSRNNAGTVNLTSADPRDTPRITFRSFGEGDPSRAADADKDLQAVVVCSTAFSLLLPLPLSFATLLGLSRELVLQSTSQSVSQSIYYRDMHAQPLIPVSYLPKEEIANCCCYRTACV